LQKIFCIQLVAPRAGAWIEIDRRVRIYNKALVAPRAGAWIEIFPLFAAAPLRRVAPRAGAWIEIFLRGLRSYGRRSSLPVRERGLKCRSPGAPWAVRFRSLPVRERGLKWQQVHPHRRRRCVAPRA